MGVAGTDVKEYAEKAVAKALLKELDKVTWTTGNGNHGSGVVLSDEGDAESTGPDKGHVLVAKDAQRGEEHPVIYCASTWLTKVEEKAVENG